MNAVVTGTLTSGGAIELSLDSLAGRLAVILFSGVAHQGPVVITLNRTALRPGSYFVRVITDGQRTVVRTITL